ncbi:MAG: PaaI family thioesterase [Polyangiales bacterium]
MNLRERLDHARTTGDFDPLLEAIPYARFLGFTVMRDGSDLIGKMSYADHLVGNAKVQALHGGTLGALLELTAVCKLLSVGDSVAVPKTVNITVEYLRTGRMTDTFARATVTRHGRRVANVRVLAYQDDPSKPVAAANAHFLLSPPP